MKKVSGSIIVILMSLVFALLCVGCGGEPEDTSSQTNVPQAQYCSAVSYEYTNNRPNYNTYSFTASYQTLTLYGDVYCLTQISTLHSNIKRTVADVVEEDEFSGVTSNPKDTSVRHCYGTYTQSSTDQTTSVTLSAPFRILSGHSNGMGAGERYVDTAKEGEYAISECFKKYGFKESTVDIDKKSGVMKNAVKIGDWGSMGVSVPTAPQLKEGGNPAYAKVDGMYIKMGQPIEYNDTSKVTTFKVQSIITYSDGTYAIADNTIDLTALTLALAGNAVTGKAQKVTTTTHYGKYTSETSADDKDILNVSIEASTSIVASSKSSDGLVDTLSSEKATYINTSAWTNTMASGTADEYLASNKHPAKELKVHLRQCIYG